MDLSSVHSLAILPILGAIAFMVLLAGYSWRHRQVPGAAPFAVWALHIAVRGVVSGPMPPL